MHCLFSNLANSTDHSENHRVAGRGRFAHLLFSSSLLYSEIWKPASTELEVEKARKMQIASRGDVEDQEADFDGRKGAGQYLLGTVKDGAAT